MAVWPRQMRPFPPVALPTRAARPHTAGFPRGSSPSSSFSSSQDLHAGALPQDRGMRGGAATQICPCQNTRTFRCPTPLSQHGRFHENFPTAWSGPRGPASFGRTRRAHWPTGPLAQIPPVISLDQNYGGQGQGCRRQAAGGNWPEVQGRRRRYAHEAHARGAQRCVIVSMSMGPDFRRQLHVWRIEGGGPGAQAVRLSIAANCVAV